MKIKGKSRGQLCDSNLSVSTLTKKDIEDLEFGNQLGVDFVAVSFVRNAEDIINVKKYIDDDTKVIAKIELKSAVKIQNQSFKSQME